MCGIVGSIGKYIDTRFIEEAVPAIRHRGPDSFGQWQSSDGRVFLGHARLSIIDLSPNGSQPMICQIHGKMYRVVFNGEIYNYKEIQKKLIERGHTFQSDSDTEVIVAAFTEWGKECVAKFRGMFAFAIYDESEEKLFLCRDRFGVKPLYYYKKDNTFLFSSELKALYTHPEYTKQLNKDAVSYYFQLGYIPAPHTIFQWTYKLRPGSWLEVDTSGNMSEERYWNVYDIQHIPQQQLTEKEMMEQLEHKLYESFQYRMVADVDVGIFLSGGVDSSLVAAMLQNESSKKIKTFTIGFAEKAYDEAPYAKKIATALGTDHHELYISEKDVLAEVEHMTQIFDEPFGDSSSIPTYILSKFTIDHVKVALSGDGGDELFGGYSKYEAVWRLLNMSGISKATLRTLFQVFSPQQVATLYKSFSRNTYSNVREKFSKLAYTIEGRNLQDMYGRSGTYWRKEELAALGVTDVQGLDSLYSTLLVDMDARAQMQLWDMAVYLPDDILVKSDRATMAVGLEGREPFLDHTLIEFLATIPAELRYAHFEKKHIQRQLLGKYLDLSLFERPKTGFRPPIDTWLRTSLSGTLDRYLSVEYIEKQGIFDPTAMATLLKRFRSRRYVNPDKIWLLLQFQMWWKTYMA